MDRTDSLWYHLPLAAKFVQTGYLGHIYFFDPIFLASFYPANSEVIHAVPMLFFDRDIVSTVINLGWLAVALLSAYCIGRPYGLGPQALIGSSIALGSQSLVEFQAGEALNDITGVAFVLAAVALLVNGYAATRAGDQAAPDARSPVTDRRIAPAALAFAGLAAGFAAGVKLSFLAPVAALTVGRDRDRTAHDAAPRDARLRDPHARRRRLLVPAQPDRGRQPDPLHRLGRADLAARPGAGLPAPPRLRGRPLLERHERVDELVRAGASRVVRHAVAGDARRDARGRGVTRSGGAASRSSAHSARS